MFKDLFSKNFNAIAVVEWEYIVAITT